MIYDQINIGDEISPLTKEMTQEKINKWAEVSGDFNPLHVDPKFARNTSFRGTIAHGHFPIAYISDMMTRWLKEGWILGGKLEISFLAPIRPGDAITTGGKVTERKIEDEKKYVICEVFCKNQKGEKVVVGKATGLVK